MIPAVVHRIWLDDPMPRQFAEHGQAWQQAHPGWTVRDWRDSDDLPPLANQDLFDQARDIYPRDWKRFQADLLRLELLDQIGGVYVDTDTRPRRDLTPVLAGRTCVVAYSPQHNVAGDHPITNCVMAAEPGHPWIRRLIQDAPEAVRVHGHRALAQSIGPWHLTRTYRADHWTNVTVFGSDDMFGPGGWVAHDWNTAARKRGKGVR